MGESDLVLLLREQVRRYEQEIAVLNKRLDEQAAMLTDALKVSAHTAQTEAERRVINAARQQRYRDQRRVAKDETKDVDALRNSNVTRNVTRNVTPEVLALKLEKQEPEQKQEQVQELQAKAKASTSSVTLRRNVTQATWEAYSEAYVGKYREPPVRNATVNAQMLQFVKRIGEEDAPMVAAFYLGHKGDFYTRSLHPVGLLLRDAEPLRTQWATGRQVTRTAAQLEDQSAANLDGWARHLSTAKGNQ